MKTLATLLSIPVILLTCSARLGAQFVNIPDANFKAALVASTIINTTFDSEIDSNEASAYTGSILVSSLGIADMTGIQCFTNAYALNFSNNLVTSIDLSTCGALNSINASNNALTCLDLSQQYLLTQLNATNNNLLKLNMKNFNNLNVSFFDVTNNPSLGCIQVDNAAYSSSNWLNIPAGSTFNTDCGIAVANFTTSSQNVCWGDTVFFSNTSTNATSYTWNFGDTTFSTLTNPSHNYQFPGGYPVVLTAHGDCYGNGFNSIIQFIDITNIFGHVAYSGGNVTSGTVVLLNYESFFTSFDTIAITTLGAVGEYTFVNAPSGDYLIKVFPDTILYPQLIPTYYGNVWIWDSSTVLTHGCSQEDTANVYMYEIVPSSGPGLLSGTIFEADGFGRAQGDPIHGVDVKLGITGGGLIIGNTETDVNGEYSFGNLPYGNYTIYVDIAGLHQDSSYQLILNATDSIHENLNYWVDSNSVYIHDNTGILELPANVLRFGLFPNPTSDNTTVIYTLESDAKIRLEVYNLLGIKLQTIVDEVQGTGDYLYTFNPKSVGMQPGIYFMKLSSGNKSKTLQMMVID